MNESIRNGSWQKWALGVSVAALLSIIVYIHDSDLSRVDGNAGNIRALTTEIGKLKADSAVRQVQATELEKKIEKLSNSVDRLTEVVIRLEEKLK